MFTGQILLSASSEAWQLTKRKSCQMNNIFNFFFKDFSNFFYYIEINFENFILRYGLFILSTA